MRQIITHSETPDSCQEKITCLDDDAGFYAIEIEKVGKTFGEFLYDLFNAGDQGAFAFSRLNLEKRTRWESAASNLLRHVARNPLLKLNTAKPGELMNGISLLAMLAVIRDRSTMEDIIGEKAQALRDCIHEAMAVLS